MHVQAKFVNKEGTVFMLGTVLKAAFGPVFTLDDRFLKATLVPLVVIACLEAFLYAHVYPLLAMGASYAPQDNVTWLLILPGALQCLVLAAMALYWQRLLLLGSRAGAPGYLAVFVMVWGQEGALRGVRFLVRLVSLLIVWWLVMATAGMLFSLFFGAHKYAETYIIGFFSLYVLTGFMTLGMWGLALAAVAVDARHHRLRDTNRSGEGVGRRSMFAHLVVFLCSTAVLTAFSALLAVCIAGVLSVFPASAGTDYSSLPPSPLGPFAGVPMVELLGVFYELRSLQDSHVHAPKIFYWTNVIMGPFALWWLTVTHAGANAALYRLYRRDGLENAGRVERQLATGIPDTAS